MPNRIVEEIHLLQARSHIVAATARIANQCLIIGRLRAQGLDTRQAEACLRTMQQTLARMRQHKELIEEMLVVPQRRQHQPSIVAARQMREQLRAPRQCRLRAIHSVLADHVSAHLAKRLERGRREKRKDNLRNGRRQASLNY